MLIFFCTNFHSFRFRYSSVRFGIIFFCVFPIISNYGVRGDILNMLRLNYICAIHFSGGLRTERCIRGLIRNHRRVRTLIRLPCMQIPRASRPESARPCTHFIISTSYISIPRGDYEESLARARVILFRAADATIGKNCSVKRVPFPAMVDLFCCSPLAICAWSQ